MELTLSTFNNLRLPLLGILKDNSVENKSKHIARTKKQQPQRYFSNFCGRTTESKQRLLHVYSEH